MNVWKYEEIRNPKQFFRHIKWCYQRITRGFCDYDIWDLRSFYLGLLIDSLKYFKNHTQTYPNRKEYGETPIQWRKDIEAIIIDLEFVRRAIYDFGKSYHIPYRVWEKRLRRAMMGLTDIFIDLWD